MGDPINQADENRRRIVFASDHAGFALKHMLYQTAGEIGYEVVDLGTTDAENSVHYPEYGFAIARAIAGGDAELGIAVCGSGIGISIAANRQSGARAALCHDATTARLSRQHNDANILALGARIVGAEVALECMKVFLTTEFEGGRHAGRVAMLSAGAHFDATQSGK